MSMVCMNRLGEIERTGGVRREIERQCDTVEGTGGGGGACMHFFSAPRVLIPESFKMAAGAESANDCLNRWLQRATPGPANGSPMGGRRTVFSAGTTTLMYETQASHVVYSNIHTYSYTRMYTCACISFYIHVCVCIYECSCSVRRVGLVDDPGYVNDFHGKFSPPKMAKLAVHSSGRVYPRTRLHRRFD